MLVNKKTGKTDWHILMKARYSASVSASLRRRSKNLLDTRSHIGVKHIPLNQAFFCSSHGKWDISLPPVASDSPAAATTSDPPAPLGLSSVSSCTSCRPLCHYLSCCTPWSQLLCWSPCPSLLGWLSSSLCSSCHCACNHYHCCWNPSRCYWFPHHDHSHNCSHSSSSHYRVFHIYLALLCSWSLYPSLPCHSPSQSIIFPWSLCITGPPHHIK